jgi:spore coat polysaccharide biosynthesis protein SpsF
MKHVGLVTVRTKSSRLKNKCLLNLDSKTKVIEHIILRCLGSGIIPIICTTKNKADQVLVKIANKFKIRFFRGSEKNKIKRWHDCCIFFKLNEFHTIDADDLYFDPLAVKKSLYLTKTSSVDLVHPSTTSRIGGASEGYTFTKRGIKKLYNSLIKYKFSKIDTLDTEMIDSFIKEADLKETKLIGQNYEIKKNIRLTLDYKEDFKLFKIIFKKFGIYEERKKINFFLKKNKHLLKINFFKNKFWDIKQKKFQTALKKND